MRRIFPSGAPCPAVWMAPCRKKDWFVHVIGLARKQKAHDPAAQCRLPAIPRSIIFSATSMTNWRDITLFPRTASNKRGAESRDDFWQPLIAPERLAGEFDGPDGKAETGTSLYELLATDCGLRTRPELKRPSACHLIQPRADGSTPIGLRRRRYFWGSGPSCARSLCQSRPSPVGCDRQPSGQCSHFCLPPCWRRSMRCPAAELAASHPVERLAPSLLGYR